MDFINDRWVTTRRVHICHGCAKEYDSGTYMKYQTSVESGTFYSRYVCETCHHIVLNGHEDDGFNFEDGYDFGELREMDPYSWESVYRYINEIQSKTVGIDMDVT